MIAGNVMLVFVIVNHMRLCRLKMLYHITMLCSTLGVSWFAVTFLRFIAT